MREPFCHARTILKGLLLAQIFISFAVLVITIIFYSLLIVYMGDAEKILVFGHLFNIIVLSLEFIIANLFGIWLWRRIWCVEVNLCISLAVNIWLIMSMLCYVCGFGTLWCLYLSKDTMTTTVQASMVQGIDLYYACPKWKLKWDSLQYYKQCCGANSYTDWMHAIWMPNDVSMCSMEQKTALAPYACCKQDNPECFKNYSPKPKGVDIPYLKFNQINRNGCLPSFESQLMTLIYILLTLLAFLLKAEFGICWLSNCILTYQNQSEENSCITECSSVCGDALNDMIQICSKCGGIKRFINARSSGGGDEGVDTSCICPSSQMPSHRESMVQK